MDPAPPRGVRGPEHPIPNAQRPTPLMDPAPLRGARGLAPHRAAMLSSLAALSILGACLTAGFAVKPSYSDGAPQANGGRKPPAEATYYRDVEPVLRRACDGCHAPGRCGPFALTNYREARKRADLIALMTQRRLMPPWLPTGPSGRAFVGYRGLTPRDIALLTQWARDDAPAGTAPLHPLPEPAVSPGGAPWRLGPPDRVVRLAAPFRLAAEGAEVCPSFVLPLNLTGPRWVRAVDVHPSNAPIVRSAALFLDTPSGAARQRAAESGANGYYAFSAGLPDVQSRFSDWSAGGVAHTLPPDVGMPLKPGDALVLMLRCQTTGQPEMERTEIGLYFTPRPPRRTPIMVALGATEVYLKANQTMTLTDELTLPVAAQALRVAPHSGLRCRQLLLSAGLPDGTSSELLRIDAWDPRWSEPYQWAAPISLPAGTRLTLTASYDNTAANPINAGHPLMSVQPSTEFMDENAGVQIQLLAERPDQQDRLRDALARRPDRLRQEKHGGQGHG
jgi:hypothetical protein